MEEEKLLNEDELVVLEGFITSYRYENESNGYRVASFKIDDNKQERTITIVGYFPRYNKIDALILKGKMIRHKLYGLQVEVVELIKKLPTSRNNIIRFLSSSQFKGIGIKTATEIYECLLDDCISILINEPDVYIELVDKKIINEKQAETIKLGLRKFDFTSNGYQILLKYGFSLKNIMKAEATYGEELENVIYQNPYKMIMDIDGIGFKTVDRIALNMGIDQADKRRVKAAIVYTLNAYCQSSGDTYTTINVIKNYLSKLIIIDEYLFNNYLSELIIENQIINIEDKYFPASLYNAEKHIAKEISPFIYRNLNKVKLDLHFEEMINIIEEDEGITYSDEQKNAIYEAASSGLYIITGGPGTGKTTILNAILKMLKMLYGEEAIISLCAPTGRASKRMSMLSKHFACTIHRLLKWDLHSNSFAYNANNKLHSDVIIVDEVSMVDTLLFEALLVGTIGVSQIILIGDDGQIPSVGAGNLLHDLLQIEQIKHISLSKIYRQGEDSSIVDLAHKVRYNNLNENFKFGNDVSFLRLKNVDAPKTIVSLVQQMFDNGLSFDDIQIIIPMYANVAGIDNINSAIQEWYNPPSKYSPEVKVNHQVFRVGDRVLQLKNQPEDDIFNGDIGVISEIDIENKEVTVEFDVGEVIYTNNTIANLTLAYAISIHKSQGSEFDFVILCVFPEYGNFLNKQLIYTGLTRAKKNLIIAGDFKTFIRKTAIENKNIRKTDLIARIHEQLAN